MKQIIRIIFYGMIFIASVTGCSKDEADDTPEEGVLIQVETPRISGWSSEKNVGTRSQEIKTVKQKGDDGLDMKADLRPDHEGTAVNKTTTRWANMNNNTIFRVLAYECTNATNISITNYKGYGDYKLLTNGTIETVKQLIIPTGTYTFVCYSYGDANPIANFNNSTASIAVSHGKNFMTCIKPNININISGSKYTLSNILFKLRCVRYRVVITAESGRMANITSCSGTLTLPSNSATFSFTNDEFIRNSTAGSINLKWNNPNAMSVSSDYIYILPQTSNSITLTISPTIGGKTFTNKSITLPSIRFNRGEIYNTKISFTTTEGYIVGGAFWANGNLYYNNGYKFYNNTYTYSSSDNIYWAWNVLNPTDHTTVNTSWEDSRDPCQQITGWRSPTHEEASALIALSPTVETYPGTTIAGVRFGKILFLPKCGYRYNLNANILQVGSRGLYWLSSGYFLDFYKNNDSDGVWLHATTHSDGLSIRCVRK